MASRIVPINLAGVALLALFTGAACSTSRGKLRADVEILRPDKLTDFNALYGHNCAGCHGADGKGGAAIALANPVLLAITDDATISRITANGMAGTSMPGFAQSAGGMLTDQQVGALVRGLRSWEKSDILPGEMPPPYKPQESGDPKRGAETYRTYCSSCHGVNGRGGNKASSIVNGSYLALVNDQDIRTIVIAGRPELGAPDWRGDVKGRAMSEHEISDVVAWLSSQRPQFPGQPYSNSPNGPAHGEMK